MYPYSYAVLVRNTVYAYSTHSTQHYLFGEWTQVLLYWLEGLAHQSNRILMQDIVHIEISSAMWTSVLSRYSVSNRYGLWRNAITHYTIMTFHNHGNQLLAVSPPTTLPTQKHLSSQQPCLPNFLAVNLQLPLIPMPTQITHGSLTCRITILTDGIWRYHLSHLRIQTTIFDAMVHVRACTPQYNYSHICALWLESLPGTPLAMHGTTYMYMYIHA